jgi:hypothetical protein
MRFAKQSMSRDFRSAMAYSVYEPVERVSRGERWGVPHRAYVAGMFDILGLGDAFYRHGQVPAIWKARTFIEYERLTGSAADSPLVTQRGSPNQLTYGVGATYSFNMHPWW